MDPLDTLRNDLQRFGGGPTDNQWYVLREALHPVACEAGQIIFAKQRRQLAWMFVTRGIAAAEQPGLKGEVGISRFFEPGQFCTNVTSLSKPEETGEMVVAITPVSGLIMSDRFFRKQYCSDGAMGAYLREKMMDAILYDRELLRVKTAMDVDTRYNFLASRNIDIVHRAPEADLARFIGIPLTSMQAYLKIQEEKAS